MGEPRKMEPHGREAAMSTATSASTKDIWDKLSTASGIVAAILVPVAVALVGSWYSDALKERQIELNKAALNREWAQIGLSILRDANTKDNMRRWAIDLINKNSDLQMPEHIQDDFVNKGAVLPPAATPVLQGSPATPDYVPPPTPTDRVATMAAIKTLGIAHLLNRELTDGLADYHLP